MRAIILVSVLSACAGCAATSQSSGPQGKPTVAETERSKSPPASSIASTARQLPFAETRVPFARYLSDMHPRIHEEFDTAYVGGELSKLPADHPLNEPKLYTVLELQIDGETGALLGARTVRSSEEPEFDRAVIDAVRDADPFSPAPPEIRSTDGNVYVHWEFHRKREYSCSALLARPYLLSFSEAKGPPSYK